MHYESPAWCLPASLPFMPFSNDAVNSSLEDFMRFGYPASRGYIFQRGHDHTLIEKLFGHLVEDC